MAHRYVIGEKLESWWFEFFRHLDNGEWVQASGWFLNFVTFYAYLIIPKYPSEKIRINLRDSEASPLSGVILKVFAVKKGVPFHGTSDN